MNGACRAVECGKETVTCGIHLLAAVYRQLAAYRRVVRVVEVASARIAERLTI